MVHPIILFGFQPSLWWCRISQPSTIGFGLMHHQNDQRGGALDESQRATEGLLSPFCQDKKNTLWLFNIAMESGPFTDDFPCKTSIYNGFSMAMLNNPRVYTMFIHYIDFYFQKIKRIDQNHSKPLKKCNGSGCDCQAVHHSKFHPTMKNTSETMVFNFGFPHIWDYSTLQKKNSHSFLYRNHHYS